MAWRILVHPEAREELKALPVGDRMAIENAIEKLAVLGGQLGAPHTSSIRGVGETLRELRPRAGRSRWRAFYRRVGDQFVIAAISPEANVNPKGFRGAVANALARLNALDLGQDGEHLG
jgi:mRNA-degrading endonuclease RelE of RelBE toxin-antitoxin system